MRRQDRNLTDIEAFEIIDKSQFAVLSCFDFRNEPEIFTIPISIVRRGKSIFVHGAKLGSKAEIFKDNTPVSFVCVSYAHVPEHDISYLQDIKKDYKKLADEVFTTEYKSVVAKTKVYKIKNENKKIEILKLLCEKYTPKYMDYFATAAIPALSKINIYEFKIYELSAKAKIL